MSRKRAKDKPVANAVPDEILAEGSGPNEVIDANPQSLVAAAQGLVDKRKERKAGKRRAAAQADAADEEIVSQEPAAEGESGSVEPMAAEGEPGSVGPMDAEAVEAASAEPVEAEAVEAAPEPAPARGKRRKKSRTVEAVEPPEQSDAVALAESDVALAELEAEALHADEVPDELDSADPDESAFDAAADNVAAESLAELTSEVVATAEGEAIALVEDAVMRAEAEAELGDAEDLELAEAEELGGAALPTTAASMDAAQLKNLVEALVFAADKPVTLLRLRQLTRVSDVKRLEQALAEIAADYQNRGVALQSVSGGYQFRTNTHYSVWVQQLIAGRPVRLSRAQLETLAIVAYRQPITRPEIDEIRGVDSSATLRLLLDRSMIRTLGKKEDVGRPMLYGTTKEFLDFFSLSDLRELPTLREYSELTAESRKVMTDRLGLEPGTEGSAPDGDMDGGDAPVSAMDSTGSAIEPGETNEPGATDDSSMETESTLDASDDLGETTVLRASSTTTVRDGIEYDRWGQPLGPIGDELDAESSVHGDVGSDETSSDDDAIAAAADDHKLETSSAEFSDDHDASDELPTVEASDDSPSAVETASDDMPSAVETASDDMPSLVEAASDDMPSAVETASDDMPSAVETASDDMPSAVEAASDDMPSAVETASDDMPSTVETASDDMPSTVETASDDMPSAVEAASDDMPSTVEAASDDMPSTVEAASDDMPSAVETASDDMPSVVEAASDDMPSAVEAASDDMPSAVEAASDDMPSTVEAASDGMPSAVEAASDDMPSAVEAASDDMPSAFEAASDDMPSAIEAASDELVGESAAVEDRHGDADGQDAGSEHDAIEARADHDAIAASGDDEPMAADPPSATSDDDAHGDLGMPAGSSMEERANLVGDAHFEQQLRDVDTGVSFFPDDADADDGVSSVDPEALTAAEAAEAPDSTDSDEPPRD